MAKRKTNGKAPPAPEPMFFAQVPKEPEYDRIAKRVLAAIHEFNASLKEAHECAEMRVFISTRGNGDEKPLQLQPQIYKLTHATLSFEVRVKPEDNMTWQEVKRPDFKQAAGQGLSALQNKKPIAGATV